MNPLSVFKEQLTDSLHQMSANWNSAKGVWDDGARQDFEKEFMAEFETTTANSIDRLQELIDTIALAEREIP